MPVGNDADGEESPDRPSPIIPGEEEKCKRLRRLFLRPDAAKAWNGGGMQKEKKPELSVFL